MKQYLKLIRHFAFVTLLLLCVPVTSLAQETEEINGVTYDVVTITVDAPSYDTDKPPVFAKVKYNKLCPMVITSDDMGRVEFVRNWAFFNGYPVIKDNYAGQMDNPLTLLNAPYDPTTLSNEEKSLHTETYQPLTYNDGTGGVRRFTATSAIMPYKIGTNYTLMNSDMAKVMVRTRWSFAQHDVADNFNGVEDVNAYIKEKLPVQSDIMKDITGYGLKVLVEPNGDHRYIKAAIESDNICWNIFQNSEATEYPAQSKLISAWTNGSMPTTFTSKPTGAWERFFFQDHETTLKENYIDTADGTSMILGGTHGMTNAALNVIKEIAQGGSHAKADQFWVAGADEVWEYYHLYNNAKITDISYAESKLTFKVKIPQYEKHQFRELTINIPGITNGNNCSFSNNVVIGGAKQNKGQYTINIGLETDIRKHIDELIDLSRANLTNEYIKRDAQYLISLLLPGTEKTNFQSRLDAEPNYSYTIKATSNNNVLNKELSKGYFDTAEEVVFPFPKYILQETTLYQADPNANQPYFVKQFTPSGKDEQHTIEYKPVKENVIFYSEGEQLEGSVSITDVINSEKKGTGEPYHALMEASNGIGGAIKDGTVRITQLQPGVYTLVAGVGDTWHDDKHNATFTFKLGDKTIYNFTTDASGVKEYIKEDIIVKAADALTVDAVETGNARWLDYIYLQKNADYDVNTPDINLTTSPAKSSIKVSDGENNITLTATATPHDDATISMIVIKDGNGTEVTSATNSNTCQYVFYQSTLGEYKFSAEVTDSKGLKGVSDEITVTVTVDLSYEVTSNLGDLLSSKTYTDQTAYKTICYNYPRYILKNKILYETAANTGEGEPRYGKVFELNRKDWKETINYEKKVNNVIFYSEGETISGMDRITGDINGKKGTGDPYWALFYASNGIAGGKKDGTTLTVTTLGTGTYHIVAGIGETWLAGHSGNYFSFKSGNDEILHKETEYDKCVTEYDATFTVSGDTEIKVSAPNSGNARWLDYIYIQRVGDVPVTIGSTGYATFSSPYALDFRSSDIKAYTATVTGGKVMMNKVVGSVPASTGLFLQGSTENIPLATDIPPTITGNALMPHLETGTVDAGNYVFSRDKTTGDLSFRRLNSATVVPGGRAYLSVPGETRNLTIEMDDVTGIRLVPMEPATLTSPAYNLQGLPVSEQTKGIIIRNGKKYINTKKQ